MYPLTSRKVGFSLNICLSNRWLAIAVYLPLPAQFVYLYLHDIVTYHFSPTLSNFVMDGLLLVKRFESSGMKLFLLSKSIPFTLGD